MYKRHETGKDGEELAYEFLAKNNYKIITRNFRCKIGEIDIIAEDGDELVFIEVKTRKQRDYGLPAEAVDKRKKKHIFYVAEYFLMINHIENIFCRFDVIEVYIFNNKTKINHIKNCILERPYICRVDRSEDDCLEN